MRRNSVGNYSGNVRSTRAGVCAVCVCVSNLRLLYGSPFMRTSNWIWSKCQQFEHDNCRPAAMHTQYTWLWHTPIINLITRPIRRLSDNRLSKFLTNSILFSLFSLQFRCRKWTRRTITPGGWFTQCRIGLTKSSATSWIIFVSIGFRFRNVTQIDVPKFEHCQRKVRMVVSVSHFHIFTFISTLKPEPSRSDTFQ